MSTSCPTPDSRQCLPTGRTRTCSSSSSIPCFPPRPRSRTLWPTLTGSSISIPYSERKLSWTLSARMSRGGPFPSRCRGSARGLSSKGACSMRADCFTMNWLPQRTTGCSSRSISSRSWRSRCRTRTKSCGMTGASFQNMLSLRKIRANLRRRQLILSLRNWAASARTPGNAQANRTGCSSGSSTVGNMTPCHRIWIPDPSSPVLPMPAPSPVSLRKRNNITERL